MTRSTRSRLHLLLVLLLCLVATSACSSAGRPDPDRRATSSAITQGQVDTDGSFRWIARVDTPTGICSGTLISPSVVLTAAHCLENYAQGCGTFRYRQPATYEFHLDPPHTADFRSVIGYLPSAIRVEFAQFGRTLQDDDHHSLAIPVDAIRIHPRGYQVNLDQCFGSCGGPEDYYGLFTPFDVALMHLAVPLDDSRLAGVDAIAPAKYIAGFGQDEPYNNRYDFDPFSAMRPDHTRVLVGGTSEKKPAPPAAREIAYATFTRFSAGLPNGRTTCDPKKLTPWSVDKSIMNVEPLHSGDGCPNTGDSGGPIILNASGDPETSGASSIPGLPDGQPLVAGDYNSGATGLGATACDPSESLYAASWDAYETDVGPKNPVYGDTQTGTFLNASNNDWDQDQVDDADDNCPIAWQQDQSNCNAIAELALGYSKRGNACDPVPCAQVTAPIRYYNVFHALTVQPIRDTFDLTLLPSHRVAAQDHKIDITPSVSAITVDGVKTDIRFCQDDPSIGLYCSNPALVNDALLDTAPSDHPDAQNPWLPVTTGWGHGSWAVLDYDGRKITVHWDYKADAKRWEQSGQINPASACSNGCCSTGLKGRIWIHTETPVGTYPAQVVDGKRADYRITSLGAADGKGLANSYLDVAPDDCTSTTVNATLPPNIPFPPIQPLYPIRWPYPDPSHPGIAPPTPWWDEATREDAMLFRLADGRYGLFRDDSYFVVIDDLLGTKLKQELADQTLVWAGAVEPEFEATQRSATLGIQALAFRADGTNIVDGAISSGSGMIALSEQRLLDPPARSAFVPVFSRVADAAFVVGGLQPGTDQPTGDIWYAPLRGGWTRVPLSGYAPDHVKAATWSARDHLLWVLDDEPHAAGHGDDLMRLVRIDPHLGVAMPVAKWRRDGYDAYYLDIDHDGNVLFTRASSHTPRYVVVRYSARPWESNATPTVAECVLRAGTLVGSPLVDPGGYTFVTRDHGAPHVDRVRALADGALATPPGLCRL